MKHIEIELTDVVTVDLLESILIEKFPSNKVYRQNWGFNTPFLWINMNYWVRVAVGIFKNKQKKKIRINVYDHNTIAGWLWGGWVTFLIFRKHHRVNVMNALREGLRERTNVVFLN